MHDTLLLFSTGEGHDSGWLSTHARAYPVSMLKSTKPYGKNTLNLFFAKGDFEDIISLSIDNGKHVEVSRAIYQATYDDASAVVVADVGKQDFVNPSIHGVTLQSDPVLYYNKIANATQVTLIPINTKTKRLNSMTLCNIHSGSATVQVYLTNAAGTLYYIIKDVVIPVGSTLKLESNELDYDGDLFKLGVKLGGSTPVDVIVR